MQELYRQWLDQATEDAELVDELLALKDAPGDRIAERFGAGLAFGTGGLRGIMGAGTSRMNIYTVRRATQGLANMLTVNGAKGPVAIAYDSRAKSDIFARQAAAVLAAGGIAVWLFPRLMPTPALSYAVRRLGCCAGICITASHNPAEYNGYKVYGPDGCQITDGHAAEISAHIESIDTFSDVAVASFTEMLQEGVIRYIGEDVVDAYLSAVLAQSVTRAQCPLRVVYTPLNGAGGECVGRVLAATGVDDIHWVEEQAAPDNSFPTCPRPNPEDDEALALGLSLCRKVAADILIATDPDCDRMGVAVRHEGDYQRLSGNEIGILLLDYLCAARKAAGTMPLRPVAVKTMVTAAMAAPVAAAHGVELREVFTGFKYIGETIGILEAEGRAADFVLGFEESCGYLSGSYVRDKDGVLACMLLCEMARWYKEKGLNLVQAMQRLYGQFGWYQSRLLNCGFTGPAEEENARRSMHRLRQAPPSSVAGLPVQSVEDYLSGQGMAGGRAYSLPLRGSNVVKVLLAQNCSFTMRPSGTEPKMKIYVSAKGNSRAAAEQLCRKIGDEVASHI